jgi:hypothetical protein
MHGAQENMVRAGYADDSGAKQWAHAKVEALFHLRLRELIVLAIGIRGVGDIRDWQPHGEAVSDNLDQFAAFKSEDGAQAGMAIGQLLQAGLEGAHVERSSQPQSEMHVVSLAFGAQLVEKPESLLSERGRIDLLVNLRLIGPQKQFNKQSFLLFNPDL